MPWELMMENIIKVGWNNNEMMCCLDNEIV